MKELKKVNFVDEVYKQMEEYIINGTWKPNSKIPSENELCKTFKVSRNTVRSAIDKLKAIGVLISTQGLGTFVNEFGSSSFADGFMPNLSLDSDEIIEILEFRKTIEVECAGYAAVRRNEADISNIEEVIEEMRESENDILKYSVADYKFHMRIAEASKNRIFIRIMYRLKDTIFGHLKVVNERYGIEKSLDLHLEIIEAIRQKDSKRARLAMENTINDTLTKLRKG